MNEIKQLMEVTPENLAQKQYDALKKHVIDKLKSIADLVKQSRWKDIEKELQDSPAGDGYGRDNKYIDFSWAEGSKGYDISEVIDHLQNLEKILNKK